jgi:hypothetical protein
MTEAEARKILKPIENDIYALLEVIAYVEVLLRGLRKQRRPTVP